MSDGWAWTAVALLGVWHGINPAMGWLFAVASGMQERSQAAVWRSLGPLAVGHALAVGAAILATIAAEAVMPARAVQWLVAGCLIGMGLYRLGRARHPRFGGMRMGSIELATWSFLMATAHGAGLMVMPLVLRRAEVTTVASHHMSAAAPASALGVTLLHSGTYLLVTAIVALLVYSWLGLRQLRTIWVNLDVVWGMALILTGIATPWV